MRLLICGSRSIRYISYIEQALAKSGWYREIEEVITGAAPGVDQLADKWAETLGINRVLYPANWTMYGKKAGILRNIRMLENCDAVVAVWDGKSKGTKHTVEEAKKRGIPVYVHVVE